METILTIIMILNFLASIIGFISIIKANKTRQVKVGVVLFGANFIAGTLLLMQIIQL